MPKARLIVFATNGASGRVLAKKKVIGSFPLEPSAPYAGTLDIGGFKTVELPSGKRVEVSCEWTAFGVNFSAAHGGKSYSIGFKANGPFTMRYYFPDDDSYVVALEGDRSKA